MTIHRSFVGGGAMLLAAATICLSLTPLALAETPKLETESYRIPAGDPGIELYIRNKHPAGMTNFSEDKVLLFVHGATYPAETAFDLPLNGVSMMDYLAQQGFDVYLVDVRGYGGSTRPAEMAKPAQDNSRSSTPRPRSGTSVLRSSISCKSARSPSSI